MCIYIYICMCSYEAVLNLAWNFLQVPYLPIGRSVSKCHRTGKERRIYTDVYILGKEKGIESHGLLL